MNEILYTLADIKDYFRGCRDNATGTARKRFEKYIESAEEAMSKMMDADRVKVVRCEDCICWETPSRIEREDGCTAGHCRNHYGVCGNQQTDSTWFCADGERVEQ